jgi:hypothetical protein
MRGNRKLNGNRIASRLVRARSKPRRSGSPRREGWRIDLPCDTVDGRLGIFDDGVEENAENNESGTV